MVKFAHQYLRPVWDFIAGPIDALGWLGKYKIANEELKEAISKVKCCNDLGNWYRDKKIVYINDGIDFTQLPWVTVARRGGDCDDFTALAYKILKDKHYCIKMVCSSKAGSQHIALVVRESDQGYMLMSNDKAHGPFPDKETAALYSYAGNTDEYFFV